MQIPEQGGYQQPATERCTESQGLDPRAARGIYGGTGLYFLVPTHASR